MGSRWGIKLQNPSSGVAPIDPTTVPNVLRVMYYSTPRPQNTLGVFPYTANPCSPGDGVAVCPDQFATTISSPLTYDRVFNSSASDGPTFQSDGLQFDTAGLKTLTLYNTAIQGGLSEFTMYLWGTLIDSAVWVALGDSSGLAVALVSDSNFGIADDSGNNVFFTSSDITAGKILCRGSINAAGIYSIQATGCPSASAGSVPPSTFSFDAIGHAPGEGILNNNLGNRHMGQIIIGRYIVPGSPEDLGLMAGISAGTYTGIGGYAL